MSQVPRRCRICGSEVLEVLSFVGQGPQDFWSSVRGQQLIQMVAKRSGEPAGEVELMFRAAEILQVPSVEPAPFRDGVLSFCSAGAYDLPFSLEEESDPDILVGVL